MRGIGGEQGMLNTDIDPTKRQYGGNAGQDIQNQMQQQYKAMGIQVDDPLSLGGTQSYTPQQMMAMMRTHGGRQGTSPGSFNYNPYLGGNTGQGNPSPLMQYLIQATGYAPNSAQMTGNNSLNVLALNQMLNLALGSGIANNLGGAGGGLPAYFGNNYGIGIGGYANSMPQEAWSALGGSENLGGMGGSFVDRMNQVYNQYANRSVPNMYADYLEMMAPRFSQGWNLYGASPALEGTMAQKNTSPFNPSAGWGGYFSPYSSGYTSPTPQWRTFEDAQKLGQGVVQG
jgi:hypothetical protein